VSYHVEVTASAFHPLKKLDPHDRPRIQGAIALLGKDPRPPGSRPLKGRPGFRVRVGDYRILYTVNDSIVTVVVVGVGHNPVAVRGD